MIKKSLCAILCLLWSGDIKALPYEALVQSQPLQNISEFDNEDHFDIKEYTNRDEPLAHQRRRHSRPHIVTHCHPVTVLGPPVWTGWGWWRYPTVITDCHPVIACDEYEPADFVETYCDYRRGRNRLLNAVCDENISRITRVLRRGDYFVDQRSDTTGETALILAAKLGHYGIVRLLVRDFNANGCITSEGLTSADWAYELDYRRIGRFLDRNFACYD